MNIDRIKTLRTSLDEENISYGELAEIESAYSELSGNEPEILASEMLDIIQDDYRERTYDALSEALTPLGLEWAVEGLMTRLSDVEAFG